jgi:hypothetical protein
MEVTVYTFRDAEGYEYGVFYTQDYQEAKEYAQANGLKIIANTFEWAADEELDDFTGADEEEDDDADD